MPRITVRPIGQVIEVDENTSVLEALKSQGLYVRSSCAGVASCGECIIKIVSGEDYLSPPPFSELKLLGNVFHITKERLSCQVKTTGDLTIDLSAHDKAADESRMLQKSKAKNARAQEKKIAPLVRKKEVAEKIREEREKIKNSPQKKETPWFKHWEKEGKDPSRKETKGQSGFRRPKSFNTDHLEEKDFSEEKNSNDNKRSDFNAERLKKDDTKN